MLLSSLALVLPLSIAMVAVASSRPQALPHEKYVLPNGMTVILHEDRSLPVATVNIWYKVGSKDEAPGRSGFAHLFEHLMFMGTERVPGSQFDELMELGGGANNATTSYDRTNYYSSGPSSLLPTLLWLEADRMEDLGRMMTQEKLDRQRDVVRNERRQSYENRPYGRADLLLDAEVFPEGHPYHIPVIGSHEDLQAATVQDVQQFFDTFYVASNASLVVAGDFETARVRKLIADLFGTLPTRPVPAHAPNPTAVRLGGVKRLSVSDSVQLARVTMAWPSPGLYAEGDADMDVLAGILAQGKSSRLWKRLVRDESLCAEIMSWQGSRQLSSVFEIEALCPPEVDLARVEQTIDEEIRRLQAVGPEDTEIRRLQNQIGHGTLVRLESLQDRADQLNAYENARGNPDSLQWDLARYQAVTQESSRKWARAVLDLDARVIVRVLTENPRANRPGPAATRPFSFPQPDTWTLASGVKVHFWNRPQLPLAAARLVLPGGASSDPEGIAGLTQLALDMLDEGTTSRTATEFSDALELLGSRIGIQARRESSSLALRSTAASFPATLELLADAVRHPALDAKEWERVRTLHRQDLQSRDDDPAQVAAVVASRRLFGAAHPFARPVDGDVASVEKVTLEQVREQLRAVVRPERATLLLAGDLSRADAERLVTEAFGDWSVPGAALPAVPVPERAERPFDVVLVHRDDAVQSVIRFAWPAPRFSDPDRVGLDLLNTILGGSFTSRLNQNLRETHGYTYGAGSRFVLMPSLGVASAQSSVRADVTGASIRELLSEFERLRGGGVTEDERSKAGETVRNRRVDATAGLDGILDQAEELVGTGLPFTEVDASLRAIDAIGAADLDGLAARRIAPRSGVLVIVGDRDSVLPQLRESGLPEPLEVDIQGQPVKR